jgi:ATP-dependent RNA helicase RhlB
VHRIGRTARAGASGKAISLADEACVLGLPAIEELIGHKIPVEWAGDDLFLKPVPRTAAEAAAPSRRRVQSAPSGRRPQRRPGSAAGSRPAQQTTAPEGDATNTKRRRRRKPRPAAGAVSQPHGEV